jgi:hypothetical protein
MQALLAVNLFAHIYIIEGNSSCNWILQGILSNTQSIVQRIVTRSEPRASIFFLDTLVSASIQQHATVKIVKSCTSPKDIETRSPTSLSLMVVSKCLPLKLEIAIAHVLLLVAWRVNYFNADFRGRATRVH